MKNYKKVCNLDFQKMSIWMKMKMKMKNTFISSTFSGIPK